MMSNCDKMFQNKDLALEYVKPVFFNRSWTAYLTVPIVKAVITSYKLTKVSKPFSMWSLRIRENILC